MFCSIRTFQNPWNRSRREVMQEPCHAAGKNRRRRFVLATAGVSGVFFGWRNRWEAAFREWVPWPALPTAGLASCKKVSGKARPHPALSTGREEGKGLEKGPCKPVKLEKNHEKGPRGSWAGSHIGKSQMIRIALPDDARAIDNLHTRSVRGLCTRDYPKEVIEAWLLGRSPAGYKGIAKKEMYVFEERGAISWF